VHVRYAARAVAPIVVGALVLSACGSNKSESNKSAGTSVGNTATIALIAPLSGSLSALGLGMKNSVDLAVRQANQKHTVKGWTIKFDPEDDQATANVGAQVAAKVASQADVVGVVGTLNSSVAQQVQPVLSQANIVMISPANTNPSLTQGPNFATAKTRPFKNYFRVATTDSIQGPFAAQYLYQTAGIKTVATINDKKTYGAGLVQQFEEKFKALGGQIVAHETINPGDKDFGPVLDRIKPKNPAAIYYGGEYPEASLISKQAKAKGMNIPLMGGDGIYDPTYIQVAGQAAERDLATSVGAPTDQLESAKAFVQAYKAAGFKESYSAYGAYAYDAANVIIGALSKVLPGKSKIDTSVRTAIIDAVQHTTTNGVTGAISFDEFGDTTNKVLTVYKVSGGAWKPEKTQAFNG
jgi:branched-chain amino acid transport system substrate-binding protein